MSEQMLTAIAARDVNGRQVFNTGLSTVGRGGETYLCGHCGHKMLSDFDMSRLEVELVFQCGACGGHNTAAELEGRGSQPPAAANDDPPAEG
jgi:DNA-directed RNA polymerase subunit RPC12/RpoP